MNKRAQTDTILNWVFYRIPITIMIVVFFWLVISYHYGTGLGSHDVEYSILMDRLINSPNLLAYTDPLTKRVYPGTIEISRFTTEHIDSSLDGNIDRIAINLELAYLDEEKVARAYFNEKKAKAWDDYVAIGGYDPTYQKRYVRVHDERGFHRAVLTIKGIIRNG